MLILLQEQSSTWRCTLIKDRGYVSSEINKKSINESGIIPTDSIYTPIEQVSHSVEPTRVGQSATYDQLTLEVIGQTDQLTHTKLSL